MPSSSAAPAPPGKSVLPVAGALERDPDERGDPLEGP